MVTVAREIDYDRVWSDQMREFDHGSDTAGYWDRRSSAFELSCQDSTYSQELMRRMDLRPDQTATYFNCKLPRAFSSNAAVAVAYLFWTSRYDRTFR